MDMPKESILKSAFRAFFRMFFAVLGILFAIIAVSAIYGALGDNAPSPTEAKTKVKYLPDANGSRTDSLTAPVILQINVNGVIGDPQGINSDHVENILLDSRTGHFANDRVKGILLYLNTPGGTVVDSDNIYQMLQQYKMRYKVPVFAYVDGLCASGGMYIASAADKIYSGPAGIIGSVGVVIGPFFNFFEAMGKLGVVSETITAGLDKDMMNPFRQWKGNEDASLKAVVAASYERFVNVVTMNRPQLSKTNLVQEYGAKVFDPETALHHGYIDYANVTRDEALLGLLKEAQVDETKTYQVVQLEPKSEWISSLFNSESPLFTGRIKHVIDTGAPNISGKIAYLYQPME